jgi:hypothetical protein
MGVAALGLSIGMGPGTAQAASVSSLLTQGINHASDEDREYLIDRNYNGIPQGTAGSNAGSLDFGDSLRGSANFNTLNSAGANLGGVTGNNEWTVVFQALVTSKSCVGTTCTYTFAPDPAFEATYGAGAMLAFYEGSGPTLNYAGDFDDPAPATPPAGPDDGTPSRTVPPSSADVSVGPYVTEEAFISTATDGPLFWVLGFTGGDTNGDGITDPAAGEGWTATTLFGDNVLAAFLLSSSQTGGIFNAGLSCVASGIGNCSVVLPAIATIFGTSYFGVSGSIRGVNDLDTPFEVSSDTQLAFTLPVPEPAGLGVMGLTLLALAGFARMRRKEA